MLEIVKSTKILSEKDKEICADGGRVGTLSKPKPETLQDYVRRIIADKGLSHVKVSQRAKHLGADLSSGSVNSILQGYVKNPGLDTVYGLSLGLGEPLDDLLDVYFGQILTIDAGFKKSAFYALWQECEKIPESDKKEVKILLDALKRDIQRRTLKSLSG